jgi:PPP family 3-phenylpropionic acid transporter
MRRRTLITKSITLRQPLRPAHRAALFYLGFFVASGSYAPFINVYFRHLGFNGRQIGLLSTLFPLTTLLFATPVSALADRLRRRVFFLTVSLGASALAVALLGLPRSFGPLLLLVGLVALLGSPIMSIADSLIARTAVRHRLNYGGIRLWGSIGFATGSAACGAVWDRLGLGAMFLTATLLFLPVVWLASQLEEGPGVEQHARGPVSVLAQDRGLVVILVATFLVGLATSTSITYDGIYLDYLGGNAFMVGLAPALSAFSELPGMRYSQSLARRLGATRMLLLAYGLMAAAFAGYVLVSAPQMLLPLAAAKGLGFGLFFSGTVYLITERAPEAWSATAQSLMSVGMFGMAPLITGPLGGLLLDGVGPEVLYAVASSAVGLAALVLSLGVARGVLGDPKATELSA